MDVKLVQSLKAPGSMIVTLLGMVIVFRPLQPENALVPMLVTLSGMVTEVSPLH